MFVKSFEFDYFTGKFNSKTKQKEHTNMHASLLLFISLLLAKYMIGIVEKKS